MSAFTIQAIGINLSTLDVSKHALIVQIAINLHHLNSDELDYVYQKSVDAVKKQKEVRIAIDPRQLTSELATILNSIIGVIRCNRGWSPPVKLEV